MKTNKVSKPTSHKHQPDDEHGMMMTSLTFADMLKHSPELRRHLKLLPWLLFPATYERKEQAALSELERERFLCAFGVLLANGAFGQLVDIHAQPHQMHGTQRFLPWHRVYLLLFEQALRSIHPDVTLPYWDWTQPSTQAVPAWLAGVTPTSIGYGGSGRTVRPEQARTKA